MCKTWAYRNEIDKIDESILKDEIRNGWIHKKLEVTLIEDKMKVNQFIWFEQMQQ